MHGFVHNACGFGDAAFGIDVCEGGKRDPDYLLSCPHCPLQAVIQLLGMLSKVLCNVVRMWEDRKSTRLNSSH